MNTTGQAILIIGLCVIATLGAQLVVRRLVRQELLSAHTEVAGIVYAALSVVYGVLLGQVVIAAWDDYTEAERAVDVEASALINLYRLADVWPAPVQAGVQTALIAYARAVVDTEWPAMADGEIELQPGGYPPMLAIWEAYHRIAREPTSNASYLQASLQELTRLDAARSQRLVMSERQLPPLLWAALIGGAVVIIAFSYLLAIRDPLLQALMLSALVALVALLLFLVHTLEFPYQGQNGIRPEPFQVMLVLTESDPPPGLPPATPVAR